MNSAIYQSYATQLVSTLAALVSESLPNTKPAWTRRIKEVVRQIGEQHGFHVCPSSVPGDEQQWLYDLIWYRNNQSNRLEEVALVLESEWSLDAYQIRLDFEKLLLANSPLKVMIFQSYENNVVTYFENLKSGINDYILGAPCMYILACYSTDGSRVEIKTITKEPISPATCVAQQIVDRLK